METERPTSHEAAAEPLPVETTGDAPASHPADPHEAFVFFEVFLHDGLDREEA